MNRPPSIFHGNTRRSNFHGITHRSGKAKGTSSLNLIPRARGTWHRRGTLPEAGCPQSLNPALDSHRSCPCGCRACHPAAPLARDSSRCYSERQHLRAWPAQRVGAPADRAVGFLRLWIGSMNMPNRTGPHGPTRSSLHALCCNTPTSVEPRGAGAVSLRGSRELLVSGSGPSHLCQRPVGRKCFRGHLVQAGCTSRDSRT